MPGYVHGSRVAFKAEEVGVESCEMITSAPSLNRRLLTTVADSFITTSFAFISHTENVQKAERITGNLTILNRLPIRLQ